MTDSPAPSPSPAPDAPESAASAPAKRDLPRALWANLASPFAVGFYVTLGGLVALLMGLAVTKLSTIIIYVAFALFAALGLDPIVRLMERHNVKRAWGIVTVFTAFAIVLVGILWLILPTVVTQIAQFVGDVPQMITDFQKSDTYHWAIDTFGDQIGTMLSDAQSFLTNPSNLVNIAGGVLTVGSTIATGISGVVIVLVLSLYFLASLPTIKKSFASCRRATARRSRS
jgi:predicted PurR-regulated permease PerM